MKTLAALRSSQALMLKVCGLFCPSSLIPRYVCYSPAAKRDIAENRALVYPHALLEVQRGACYYN